MNLRPFARSNSALAMIFLMVVLGLSQLPTTGAADPEPNQCSCAGTVVDRVGNPIERATLFTEYYDDARNRKNSVVQTDSEGRFRLDFDADIVHANYVLIWIYAVNHSIQPLMVQALFDDASHIDGVRIPMPTSEPIPMSFHGPDGQPVNGGRVVPYDMKFSTFRITDDQCIIDDQTNVSGALPRELAIVIGQRVKDDGTVLMNRCSADRFSSMQFTSAEFGTQVCYRRNDQRDYTLSEVGRIIGKVRMENPSLLTGTRFYFDSTSLTGARSVATTGIDTSGEFLVPAITPSAHVHVRTNWDPSLPFHPVMKTKRLAVKANQTTVIEIQTVKTVAVQGQVLTADTSEPVPGAIASLNSLSSLVGHVQSATDQDGRFTVRVAPGTTLQQVVGFGDDPRFLARYDSPYLGNVRIPDGVETFQLDPFLLTPKELVRGQLTDSRGHPIADVEVLYHKHENLAVIKGRGMTDTDGRFQMRVGEWETINSSDVIADHYHWSILLKDEPVHGIRQREIQPLQVQSLTDANVVLRRPNTDASP